MIEDLQLEVGARVRVVFRAAARIGFLAGEWVAWEGKVFSRMGSGQWKVKFTIDNKAFAGFLPTNPEYQLARVERLLDTQTTSFEEWVDEPPTQRPRVEPTTVTTTPPPAPNPDSAVLTVEAMERMHSHWKGEQPKIEVVPNLRIPKTPHTSTSFLYPHLWREYTPDGWDTKFTNFSHESGLVNKQASPAVRDKLRHYKTDVLSLVATKPVLMSKDQFVLPVSMTARLIGQIAYVMVGYKLAATIEEELRTQFDKGYLDIDAVMKKIRDAEVKSFRKGGDPDAKN